MTAKEKRRVPMKCWTGLLALVLLAGCAASRTEMPANDAAGTDRLKRSPCACAELDYEPETYEWLGKA